MWEAVDARWDGAEREVRGHVARLGHRTVLIREATAAEVGGAEREREIGAGVIVGLMRARTGEGEVVVVAGGGGALGEGNVRLVLFFAVRM